MVTLQNFYSSNSWIKFREQLILERTNAEGEVICARCGKPIYKKYDIIGHHIKPLNEVNVNDALIALNPDNVELIHFKCHNKEHKRWDGFEQAVYLVWGSPCAGKTTWVIENAFDDDLIVDMDRIWECLEKGDREHKSNRIKANVFGVRDCLIEQIKLRKGMWRNAYVIGGYPLPMDRERICGLLGARCIHIDTPKDVCLSRAVNDDWRCYVEEWWEVAEG